MPGKDGEPMEVYPSDLSDDEWAILEPLIPPEKPGGRPREVDMHAVLDGIFYVLRSGCAWRMLPREYPPRSTVYGYFALFRDEGVWERIMATLREVYRVQAGREATPSAGIIDSQSIKTTERGGPCGYDGGKKVRGRKRHVITYPQICQQVQALTEAGWAATAIAQALNNAGYCPPHTTARFRAQTIRELQRRLGVRAPRPRVRQRDGLLPDEWWPAELVRALEIPRASLYHWISHGLVRARQLDEPLHRWVVWADEAEQERLRRYHQRAIREDLRHRWTDAPLAEQPE